MVQTLTSISAGSICCRHASQTLKLLPCICSHMVLGNPVNSLLKQDIGHFTSSEYFSARSVLISLVFHSQTYISHWYTFINNILGC